MSKNLFSQNIEFLNKNYINRKSYFDSLPIEKKSILMVGNSLTQGFEPSEIFHNVKIKNRGISGDQSFGVLKRIKSVMIWKPKKIFFEIGINDLGHGVSIDSLLKNYKKILDSVKAGTPKTKIYIESILPVCNTGDNNNYCNKNVNQAIREANEKLKTLSKKYNCIFIDLYSSFEINCEMNPKFCYDGIHLTPKGNLLWAKILKPFVEQ